MPHAPRCFCPDVVYEITAFASSQLALIPFSPRVYRRFIGVLARARQRYTSLKLYHFSVYTTHWTYLASARTYSDFVQFLNYVQTNTAKEFKRHTRCGGTFWRRRARIIPCVDSRAAELRHATAIQKSSSTIAHRSNRRMQSCSPEPRIMGEWVDRPSYRRARLRDPSALESHYICYAQLTLDKLEGNASSNDKCKARTYAAFASRGRIPICFASSQQLAQRYAVWQHWARRTAKHHAIDIKRSVIRMMRTPKDTQPASSQNKDVTVAGARIAGFILHIAAWQPLSAAANVPFGLARESS